MATTDLSPTEQREVVQRAVRTVRAWLGDGCIGLVPTTAIALVCAITEAVLDTPERRPLSRTDLEVIALKVFKLDLLPLGVLDQFEAGAREVERLHNIRQG